MQGMIFCWSNFSALTRLVYILMTWNLFLKFLKLFFDTFYWRPKIWYSLCFINLLFWHEIIAHLELWEFFEFLEKKKSENFFMYFLKWESLSRRSIFFYRKWEWENYYDASWCNIFLFMLRFFIRKLRFRWFYICG